MTCETDNVSFAVMSLGDLQYLTLLAVARLGPDAVAGEVREVLESVAGREVAVGTVFVTLTRLEDRGLLVSHRGPAPMRGGRRARIFALTDAGREAVLEARSAMDRMWDGLEMA